MNVGLWKTCGYVCAKALDNLWVRLVVRKGGRVHTQVIQVLSTAYPQGALGVKALKNKGLLELFCLSTAITSTTLYLTKLIY